MSSKKIPVTITYIHDGALPPVFLAGSFSEPLWTPAEMSYTLAANGQYHFEKEVHLEAEGAYHYKFRLGPGDWWVLDETAPVATDEAGNRNNVITAPAHSAPDLTRPSANSTIPQSDGTPLLAPQPTDDALIPTLVVEKSNTKLSHGDDFGANATVAQKDAHKTHAADAAPDYTVVRAGPESKEAADTAAEVADTAEKIDGKDGADAALDARLEGMRSIEGSGTLTPLKQVADTAAEVADTAASLDKEDEPVPISDEEAGRTGERRMSSTPIPEVAKTAAEVADSAELIDGGDEAYEDDNDRAGYGTGIQTPAEEKAPLFAYEMVGENEDESVKDDHNGYARSRGTSSPPRPVFMDVDPNDPDLEQFPEDMEGIVKKISRTESRLEPDETKFDGVPLSPVIGPSGAPLYAAEQETPLIPTTPPLENIREEDEEGEVKETPKLKLTNPDSPGLGEANDALVNLDDKSPTSVVEVKEGGTFSDISSPLSTAEPIPSMDKLESRVTGRRDERSANLGIPTSPTSVNPESEKIQEADSKTKDIEPSQDQERKSREQKLDQEQDQFEDQQKPSNSIAMSVPEAARSVVGKAKDYATTTTAKVPKVADIVETFESRATISRDSSPAPKSKDAGTGWLSPSTATGTDTKDHSTGRAGRLEMSSDGAYDSDEDKTASVPPTMGSSSTVDTGAGGTYKDGIVRKRASVPVPERPRSVDSIRPRSASEGSIVKVNRGWLMSIWQTVFGGLFGWLGRIFGGGGRKTRSETEGREDGEGREEEARRSLGLIPAFLAVGLLVIGFVAYACAEDEYWPHEAAIMYIRDMVGEAVGRCKRCLGS